MTPPGSAPALNYELYCTNESLLYFMYLLYLLTMSFIVQMNLYCTLSLLYFIVLWYKQV